MSYSLILGGTKGIGLSLAKESVVRGITPIVTGRSAGDARTNPSLPNGAISITMDLTDYRSVAQALAQIAGYPVEYFIWNAAIWPGRVLFRTLSLETIDAILTTNFLGPLKMLRRFHEMQVAAGKPYHLIGISSTSAWTKRYQETVYCASKEAQAAFMLNFADELARELPGSLTSIFYPGGTKTEIFGDTGQDMSGYMEPDAVAKVIWDEILNQKEVCKQVHLIRDKEKNDGSFIVEYGPKPKGIN